MNKILNDNCLVCGNEYEVSEFIFPVVSASNFKICNNCFNQSNPENDYYEVKNIISRYVKFSQQMDPELASPEIKIEPVDSVIQQAVNLLKTVNPNYFVGIRKIVVDSGQGFGHVSAGGNEDPTVIHVNLPKIKAELQGKLSGLSKEQTDRELVRQVAFVISHEKGHVNTYEPKVGFLGEGPAETEETSMIAKIDNFNDKVVDLK